MNTIKNISSTQNESIKAITALHQAKYRAEYKKFIAEGARIIQTLLHYGTLLDQLYLIDITHAEPLRPYIPEEKITIVTESVMSKISMATSPSGILAVFHIPQTRDLATLNDGLVLAEIADPGNMGTLMRTAAAMGKSSVVLVGGVEPWNPKVVQASAGTIGKLTLFTASWQELVATANKRNLQLIALVVEGGKSPEQLTFANSLLVVGNEARGLSESWVHDCSEKMTIPMPGNIESLNAAVAGSIALYLAYEHQT
jgi:RNA methyltransferase, TrmH family